MAARPPSLTPLLRRARKGTKHGSDGGQQAASSDIEGTHPRTLRERLNTEWHERALQVFMLVVLAHWAEHLAQALPDLRARLAGPRGARRARLGIPG